MSGRVETRRVILSDCRLIDGAGNPWVAADVELEAGRVAAIWPAGSLAGRAAATRAAALVIDVEGRYVTPGFVDPHTHSDLTVLTDPGAESAVYQGVTTHVVGNCGMSAAPVEESRLADFATMWESYWESPPVTWRSFAEYLATIEGGGSPSTSPPWWATARCASRRWVSTTFGRRARARPHEPSARREHGGGRLRTLDRPRLPAGLPLLDRGADRPGAGRQNYAGIYTSHVRGERETIVAAVEEAVRIGAESGLPVQVSHNAPKWGGPPAAENLAVIERARARGADVTLDNDVHTELAPRCRGRCPSRCTASRSTSSSRCSATRSPRRAAPRDRRRRRPPGSGLRGPDAPRALRAHRSAARRRHCAARSLDRRHRRGARGRPARDLPRPHRRGARRDRRHLRVHRPGRARGRAVPPLCMVVGRPRPGPAKAGRAGGLLALQFRRVPGRAGAFRARSRAPASRGGRAQDDLAAGPALRLVGSRRAASRGSRRPRGLRPRTRARPGD